MKNMLKNIKKRIKDWNHKVKTFEPDYFYISRDEWEQVKYVIKKDADLEYKLGTELVVSLRECESVLDLNKRQNYITDIVNCYTDCINVILLIMQDCDQQALQRFNLMKPEHKSYFLKIATNNDVEFVI